MYSTVVGSFPADVEEPASFKDKLLNVFNLYDPYKSAIRKAVFKQLEAGIDVISDGQVRGDMVSSFTKYIPGMSLEGTNTVINGKIQKPTQEITVKDLKYAKSLINEFFDGDVPEKKGIKGIITGPSTIVFSSRIASFYKNKNDAILDLANSLKYEVMAIEKNVNPKYIQIDEPFLSTGMVDFKTAREAISIISESVDVPISMHVCGNLDSVFKELTKFKIDILDCEFAGNDVNIDVLRENVGLIKNKKIGFGCIDTSVNKVDSYADVQNLVREGIDILGTNHIILDPDCGLRRASPDVAFEKLQLISRAEEEFS
ncbi:MAG: methionine synthase [Methanobrevibacter sp.]|uniref:methionine synthase n=1 Tax=Methanobrevibacter sp. TaxID=66852 RepID=UPI0026DFF30B|nr:methionine synthase [Methanobrevibacter sp.]MDO5849237.1 methionine synthase [Methanobrevibacter sp.]